MSHAVLDRSLARTPLNSLSATGFLLIDLSFKSLYANQPAVEILSYGGEFRSAIRFVALAQERLRGIFKMNEFAGQVGAVTFQSGRRHYICRPFLIEGSGLPAMAALLFERQLHDSASRMLDGGRRFHLSPRECETVLLLSHGMTTKEIADRMSVSPNTIKQFVRTIMSKMGVTTRTGIIGKLNAS